MAGKIGRLDPFDSSIETWEVYQERLEQYFVCNDVKDEKKVPVLLTLIGSSTYSLLRGLTAPAKPSEKSYDDLVNALRRHLCPKPLIIAERFRFHKREQTEGESILDYTAALRKLSEHCEFDDANLNDMLRDRLVCGLRNENIQKKLLSEDKLTFKSAVDIAVAMETAARDTTELQAKHGIQAQVGVNKIFKAKGTGKRGSFGGGKPRDKLKTKKCYRCLGTDHEPQKCYFRDKECFKCHKKGHSKRACRSQSHTPVGGKNVNVLDNGSSDEEFISSLEFDINSVNKSSGVITVQPEVNGVTLDMELDTGAAVSVIPEQLFRSKFDSSVKLQKSDVILKTYSGERIKPVGLAHVKVKYQDQCPKDLNLYVVKTGGVALFGRDWLKHITLNWSEIKSISCAKPSSLKAILDKHPSVFHNDWGTLKGIKAKLTVKPGTNPKFVKARQVPYALKPKVEAELEKLVRVGILQKCDYSEWATPIVPVAKKDGSVRLCGDFKVTVNPVLEVDQYPLPRIEDIFTALSGGKHFSKIDLKHAYLQMEVEDESRPLLTINTEKGLYRYNRLVYGVASAPAIWQRSIDIVLQGLSGVKCIIDDMIITGKTEAEHLHNLDAVLSRLAEYGLRVNLDKCEFFKDKVTFCGHEIDHKGLHKTAKKIEAVVNAPQPTNVSELRSFLGIVNYYSRFLPNLSTVLHPLYALLEKDRKWYWGNECQESFQNIKKLITSEEVLTHYDPDLPLCLATDASSHGLGAVLSHIMPNGHERPIAYASRSLSTTEKRYSQIEKEALGIVWGVKRFNTYLYGRHFRLITDHEPLISIFGPKKGISTTSAARLQRQALFLTGYNYEIVYKSTRKHGNADCLSRLPVNDNNVQSEDDAEDEADVEMFHISHLQHLPLKNEVIQRETRRDPLLSAVYENVANGWSRSESKDMDPYFSRRCELTIQQNCLLWGLRVIIPPALRSKVLQELHQGHIGVVKMKTLARSYVWWPGIDHDIETLAKSCSGCQGVKNAPHTAPIYPWEWPSRPWERVHVDFAGPFLNSMFLVMVDSYSKWPEVIPMRTTTTARTIDVLRTVFARTGLPTQIVSDNGPQFTSEEFANFTSANGIKHIRSAPYHPRTNGLAERFVQSFKMSLKSSKKDDGGLIKKLSNFLMAYRNAPQCTTNESPAKLFIGRNLPSRLDLLKPDIRRKVENKQCEVRERRTSLRRFEPGNIVSVRDYRKDHSRWTTGKVVTQTGPVSYRVEVAPGVAWRRHTDQLRSSEVQIPMVMPQGVDSSRSRVSVEKHVLPPCSSNNGKSPSQTESKHDSASEVANRSTSDSVTLPESRYPSRRRTPPKYLEDFVKC